MAELVRKNVVARRLLAGRDSQARDALLDRGGIACTVLYPEYIQYGSMWQPCLPRPLHDMAGMPVYSA